MIHVVGVDAHAASARAEVLHQAADVISRFGDEGRGMAGDTVMAAKIERFRLIGIGQVDVPQGRSGVSLQLNAVTAHHAFRGIENVRLSAFVEIFGKGLHFADKWSERSDDVSPHVHAYKARLQLAAIACGLDEHWPSDGRREGDVFGWRYRCCLLKTRCILNLTR